MEESLFEASDFILRFNNQNDKYKLIECASWVIFVWYMGFSDGMGYMRNDVSLSRSELESHIFFMFNKQSRYREDSPKLFFDN